MKLYINGKETSIEELYQDETMYREANNKDSDVDTGNGWYEFFTTTASDGMRDTDWYLETAE